TDCLWDSPSPGTAYARAPQTVRRVRPDCWLAQPRVAPERPTANPSPAAGDEQTVRRHRRGHDTPRSVYTAGRTRHATPPQWAGGGQYGRDAAIPPGPRTPEVPARGFGAPPGSRQYG